MSIPVWICLPSLRFVLSILGLLLFRKCLFLGGISVSLFSLQFSSVAQLCLALRDRMGHSMPGLPVHHQLPESTQTPCPLGRWCYPAISSSVVPLSSCPQSFPASRSFPMSQLFASGGQSIGVSASASVLPVNTQDWSPLGWTGWISLQSQGRSRVFSNTIVQKHQFFHLSFLNPVNLPFLHSFEMLLLPHIKFPPINEANLGLQFLFCQFFCLHLSQCHMNSIPLAI